MKLLLTSAGFENSKVGEAGFDKIIKQFLEKRGIYVGVSAGSIIVGPDIDDLPPLIVPLVS